MPKNQTILVAIHSLVYQGQNLLGDAWEKFFADLRQALQEHGLEDAKSSDTLLLFNFEQAQTAFTAIFESLSRLKLAYEWTEALGQVPIQLVFHLEKPEDLPSPLRDVTSNLWQALDKETPYVSRALKLQWDQLALAEKLPPHSFEDAQMGMYLLKFSDPDRIRTEKIFPHRALPLSGKGRPCFYCGMNTHKPANCPSKMLTMATQAIQYIGYQPIATLSDLFGKVMANQDKLNNTLAAGLTAAQIRQKPLLQVYVAYFDMMRTYQPRFLWNIAFTTYSNWDELGKPDTVTVDSHSLHMALDCLRVGQYSQAEELFVDESRRPKGRAFYATIGRAFVALELERESDMGHFLESAAAIANSQKEQIYISLLLSRYYDLQDNDWKSEHSLDNVFTVRRDCDEASFRQVQLMAKSGIGDKGIRQLRSLVVDQKELFIMALMDPQLLPIVGPVEDLLATRLETQRQDAEENMKQARGQCHGLTSWFAEADADVIAPILTDLENLEKQFNRGSYYDNLDVAKKARILVNNCYRLQESKLDELHDKIAKAATTWEGFRRFWQTYTYQSFFKDFHDTLQAGKDILDEAEAMAEKNMHGQLYQNVLEMLAKVEEGFKLLKPLSIRMGWVKIFLDGAKLFCRRLIVTEVALLCLGMALVPIIAFWLAGTEAAGIIEMVRNPWVQKQVLLVVTLLVAPLLALIQTLWRLMER